MTPNELLDITRDGLMIVFWVSLPVVLVATISALIIAVVFLKERVTVGRGVAVLGILAGAGLILRG